MSVHDVKFYVNFVVVAGYQTQTINVIYFFQKTHLEYQDQLK
jgi:hypothetical protein